MQENMKAFVKHVKPRATLPGPVFSKITPCQTQHPFLPITKP